MRDARQALLPGFSGLKTRQFGGALLKGNPREARPISTKRPIHLVMRSSLATGPKSFLSPVRARRIENLIRSVGRLKGVKVYRYANSGNHLHLIVLPRSRDGFRAFLRAITGLIARATLGAERGRAAGREFWDARPFTRILEWGRDFNNVSDYLLQNVLEAIGFIPYHPRGRKTKRARRRSR